MNDAWGNLLIALFLLLFYCLYFLISVRIHRQGIQDPFNFHQDSFVWVDFFVFVLCASLAFNHSPISGVLFFLLGRVCPSYLARIVFGE